MKATMDENGVITVSAETALESYALQRWADEAFVMRQDGAPQETGFVRGSRLIVSTALPPALPHIPQPGGMP